MHSIKGKTLAQCLTDRINYGINPEKTENNELISAFACDPHTADAEFLLSKNQYELVTGRRESSNVIAYQVRQSFRPGEVTPQEANQIGYDFASRFLKGKHTFIVCAHTDKNHIHNHIYWNSTTLDGTHKFRDFFRSGNAVRRLSDLICIEHQLSVISNPQGRGESYDKWLGNKEKPSHRELLRREIDKALSQKPRDFEEFLAILAEQGYQAKQGKYITFVHSDFKQNVRMSSLGEGYTEERIRAVIKGETLHNPQKQQNVAYESRPKTIIDLQAKLAEGKGEAYRRWATVENLKRMAKTKLYMDEHRLSYDAMSECKAQLSEKEKELSARIMETQNRLAEINILKTHIVNYLKTRDVYVGYRKSGYSKKFLTEYETDIAIHKASKKAFDECGIRKLPTIKSMQAEFSALLSTKKKDYAELKKILDELKELSVHQTNYEELRELQFSEERKEKEHGRD